MGPNKKARLTRGDDDLEIIEDPQHPQVPNFSHGTATNRNLLAEIEMLNQVQTQTQRELYYLKQRDRLWSAELVSLKAEINLLRNQIEISKGLLFSCSFSSATHSISPGHLFLGRWFANLFYA
jgi:uncharacterized protein YfcZ (UPF0381/DUF406 family)